MAPVRLVAVDVSRPEEVREAHGVVVAFGGLEIRAEVGTDVRYVCALVTELRSRC